MSETFTTTLSLAIGGDAPDWEGDVTVRYLVDWGRPETPPAYDRGALPAEPPSVERIDVTHIDGKPVGELEHGWAYGVEEYISARDALLETLLQHARESLT